METLGLESSDKLPNNEHHRSVEAALAKHSKNCDQTKKTERDVLRAGSDRKDKSPDRPKVNTEEIGDEGSFALFNESFDIASEAGRNLSPVNANETFALKESVLSPPVTGTRYAKSRRPTEIDLPSLKHNACDTSECSVGEISPIKVSFNQGTSIRKTEHHRKLPPPHPQPHFITHAQEQDLFWQQRDGFDASHTSNPYYVIRCAQHLLQGCKYYLPCLYNTEVCRVNMSNHGNIRHYQEAEDMTSMPADMTIGIRRVEAAICAFGGSIKPDQKMSIFRTNRGGKGRQFYEHQLLKRYSVSKSRISWDVEEEPPILCRSDQQLNMTPRGVRKDASPSEYNPPNASSSSTTSSQDSGKQGKYRCKQCGQPKQNHDCPYRPSLQRSIGIMVYPAVNSFTAAEPGTIAPPLSKMNNFVSFGSDYAESTSVPERHVHFPPNTVSPEALRGGFHHHSPQSTLSAQSSSESLMHTTTTPIPRNATTANSIDSNNTNMWRQKRTHAQAMGSPDRFPFVSSTLTLRPEHYRAVTPAVSLSYYDYPTIPLTFVERKRLSDTLFCLSQQVPYLTRDCGTVLRQARDDWDQAVAELLTQVVIGLYCSEGDARLDGLQRYLLALGISC